MAANIEFNSNRNTYSFYSLKDVPWHGLGTVVEEAKTPDEIIRIANMDYEVALAPMFASFIPAEAKHIVKEDNHYACHMSNGDVVIIPEKGARVSDVYATYRKDNYKILGTVGSRYEPVQNTEAMDFIYQVCKSQLQKMKWKNISFSLQVMMEVAVFRLVSLIFVLYVTIR